MCENCGCSEKENYQILHPIEKELSGLKPHKFVPIQHDHLPEQGKSEMEHKNRTIKIEKDVLQSNNLQAEQNRNLFKKKNIVALNFVSSPGSGKTSLLEVTIKALSSNLALFVIEGDQQTSNDAERIQTAGAPVIQINTGQGCHLDANMIHSALRSLDVKENSFLFIENVGNLVCPALFDLGEEKRVLIISVTEGDDKPLKYPAMFQSSDLCIINKIDLLPYVDFNIEKVKEYALRINSKLTFLEISVTKGTGMELWYNWIIDLAKE